MKFIKGLLFTLSSLAAGFIAISLPFKLFEELSTDGMHLLFISEIIIYFVTGMVFLLIAEHKKQCKAKSKERHIERNRKIKQVQEEWMNIAA